MEEDLKILEEYLKINKFINGFNLRRELRALQNLLTRYKQLEKENEEWQRAYQEEKDKQFELLRDKDSIPKSKVKEILSKEKLPLTIVGGGRNAKTLEYGKKLGKIEACLELLGEE